MPAIILLVRPLTSPSSLLCTPSLASFGSRSLLRAFPSSRRPEISNRYLPPQFYSVKVSSCPYLCHHPHSALPYQTVRQSSPSHRDLRPRELKTFLSPSHRANITCPIIHKPHWNSQSFIQRAQSTGIFTCCLLLATSENKGGEIAKVL
jgi:hypothetical protein